MQLNINSITLSLLYKLKVAITCTEAEFVAFLNPIISFPSGSIRLNVTAAFLEKVYIFFVAKFDDETIFSKKKTHVSNGT